MSISKSIKILRSLMHAHLLQGAICIYAVLLLAPVVCSAETLHDTVKKGSELYAQEKYDDALNAFVDGQIEHPENAQLKYDIASSKYMMKNYEDALKGYLDVAATARDARLEEKALFNAGNTLYRQGKLEEAIEYYKKALALAPDDKEAQQNIEFVREEIKRRMNEAKDTQKKQQQEQEQKKDQNCKNPQQQQDNQTQTPGQQQQQENKDQKQEGQEQQQGQDQQQAQQQQKTEPQPQDQQPAAAGSDKPAQEEKQQAAAEDARELSKDEAQQWLNSVRENRDNLKEGKQRVKTQGNARTGKDW